MDEKMLDQPDQEVQVLFVDDEPNIIKSLKRLFIDEPFETLFAASGLEGMEIVKSSTNLGLIVSDQRMPGLTGVDFLEHARQMAPDAIRMVLTGYADVEAAMAAINRGGAFRYITKPWSDDELVQTVREAVDLYSLKWKNKRLTEVVREQNQQLELWNEELEKKVREQTLDITNKNAQLNILNKRLKKNFDNATIAFSRLIELRDKSVRNHSGKVADISVKIAGALELSAEETEDIFLAALLHDIGKIGIGDQLLNKDMEEMTSEELVEYRQHPVRGQAAIDSILDLRNAGVLIRHHHEWFNGGGFPGGLKKDEIPVGAMIVGIADFLDRAVGRGSGGDDLDLALTKVREELGRRFDPNIYELLETSLADVYSGTSPGVEMVESEINSVDLLQVGMVLSRDVFTGTGLLLLGKGCGLTEQDIRSLRRYFELDPSEEGIFIWARKS